MSEPTVEVIVEQTVAVVEAGPVLSVDGQVGAVDLSATYVAVTEGPRSPLQAVYGGSVTAANIVAAASGGAAVMLPDGTYDVSVIALPDGSVLSGCGEGRTILRATAAGNGDVIQPGNSCTVERLTIDGQKATQTVDDGTHSNGISASGVNDIIVRNVEVKNTRSRGIAAFNVARMAIIGCKSSGCGNSADGFGAAFNLFGSDFRIVNNEVRTSAEQGIFLGNTGSTDVVIAGNRVSGTGHIGIALGTGSRGVSMTGNVVTGAGNNGIDTGTATLVTVQGNTIDGSWGGIDADLSGLTSLTSAQLSIVGNVIRSITNGHGIYVAGPAAHSGITGVTIGNNTLDTIQQHGIVAVALSRGTITHNTIRNASVQSGGFAAIHLDGGTLGCLHNNVIGNIAYEDGRSAQMYGTDYAGSNNDFNTFIGNDFSSCFAGFASSAAANDIRQFNH